MDNKTTTLRMDKDIHRKLKVYCAERDILIKTLIRELVEKEMKENPIKK